MAEEIKIDSYYQSLKNQNWIDTNICCALGSEFWISNLLFNGDVKRVLYSKEDICFRRRVETVGKGHIKDENYLNHVSLDLPFAVYSQTGNYEPDDRSGAMNAAFAVKGHYNPDLEINIKQLPMKIKYSMTAFFARREEVNTAAELLYWESNPKGPLYFIVQHQIGGYPLDIPVFMTLDQVEQNTDYQEKSWLTQSKIFPVKIDYTIRTYRTLIETLDGSIMLPLRWSGLYAYNWKRGRVVLTQNSVLEWANNKFENKNPPPRYPTYLEEIHGDWPRPTQEEIKLLIQQRLRDEVSNGGKDYPLDVFDDYPNELRRLSIQLLEAERELSRLKTLGEDITDIQNEIDELNKRLNNFLNDSAPVIEVQNTISTAIKGYFTGGDTDILLEEYIVKDVGDDYVELHWKVNDEILKNFSHIRVYIPGVYHEKIEDLRDSLVIKDLYPGSEYKATLVVTTDNREVTYNLEFKTTGESALDGNLLHKLVGRSFTGV